MGLDNAFLINGRHFVYDTPNKKRKLVHGLVQYENKGKLFWHCWIEDSQYCYDYLPRNKRIKIKKEDFYRLGKIKNNKVKKYSRQSAFAHLQDKQHWGPWN